LPFPHAARAHNAPLVTTHQQALISQSLLSHTCSQDIFYKSLL
jgi:hypothetical protein